MIRRKFLFIALILSVGILVSACAVADSPSPPEQSAQSEISVSQAREIAIAAVGGGDVVSLSVETENNDQLFHVSVMYDGNIYEVVLNAFTGGLIRLRSNYAFGEEQSYSMTTADNNIPEMVHAAGNTSGASANTTNDPISRDRAIELARDHLNSIGRGNAVFQYAYADIDDGRPVWSVEFAGGLEFYVCRNTGVFFKSPSADGSTVFSPGGGSSPSPGGGSSPSPGGGSSPSPGGGSSPSPGGGSSPSPGGGSSPSPGGGSSPSPGGGSSPSPGGGWSSPSPPPGEGPGWYWDGSWTHTWTNSW